MRQLNVSEEVATSDPAADGILNLLTLVDLRVSCGYLEEDSQEGDKAWWIPREVSRL
jgi:hypothetical protein